MHDSNPLLAPPIAEVFCAGFNPNHFSNIRSSLQKVQIESHPFSIEQMVGGSELLDIKILLVKLEKHNFTSTLTHLLELRQRRPSATLVAMGADLETDHIQDLINRLEVFAILRDDSQLLANLQEVIENQNEKSSYTQSLRKIQEQNRNLETLNQNLEGLVQERTKKEFEANRETEVYLKGIQSILGFIKMISRTESVEDLLNQVRNDFKRFYGLMPPVLILLKANNDLRVSYFQGKQFSEKRQFNSNSSQAFLSEDTNLLRGELSNFFGRPYGNISVHKFEFKSSELSNLSAKVIFEHSLNNQNRNDFVHYLSERWSIINMALETILLRDGLESIAKQWAKTFNKMKDPILILDGNYKMTLSNSDFHKDKTKTCHQAFANSNKSCKDCPIKDTFATGTAQSANIHIDGKLYKVHSYPIRLGGSERTSHVINQYVDITQSAELQSKVVQGEKLAAVGLLAGNIAHELNNPLTGIYSMAQLLLKDLVPTTNTAKDLTEVKEAALRCQRIIKDLLDFSSVGAESKATVVDVNQMIAKTLPLLKMAMRELNSDIQLWDKPLFTNCNPQLFQQVIFNLVNNACQAMSEGNELIVRTQQKGDQVEIIIRDTGSGIPDDIREFIFDPFFTTKEEGKGTGLGLSMSRAVIERYKGTLQLNDEYKNGTEFVISLPRVKS